MSLDEIRNRRDVWPLVAERIPDALLHIHQHLDDVLDHPNLIDNLERKFRKGEAEHNGAWLRDAEPSWLIAEAAEEILDFILYQAMYLVHYHARTGADE